MQSTPHLTVLLSTFDLLQYDGVDLHPECQRLVSGSIKDVIPQICTRTGVAKSDPEHPRTRRALETTYDGDQGLQ